MVDGISQHWTYKGFKFLFIKLLNDNSVKLLRFWLKGCILYEKDTSNKHGSFITDYF